MSIDVSGLRIIDLDRVAPPEEAGGLCCDLCRREEDLFRLFNSPDALCCSCFAMWHG